MTVQNENTKNIYVGNGSTTVFPFTFHIHDNNPDYIKVYVTGSDGVDVLTDNYTIDMQDKKITYPKTGEPLKTGDRLTIDRELPFLQLLNLVNQGPFFAEEIEESFDKNIMLMQQIKDKLDRALALGVGVDASSFKATIPLVPGKSLRINDEGTGFELVDDAKKVYQDTLGVLNETQAIRNETQAIRNETQDLKNESANQAAFALNSANEAAGYANNARNSEVEAIRQADRAEAYGSKAEVYDETKTYYPADVVMLSSGGVYRCIAESTGENPQGSVKWVPVSMVKLLAFELDENGDLMPLVAPRNSSDWSIDENGDVMPV